MPREGGLFRRTRAGPARPDGRPEGSAIVALLTGADFSAPHRLPVAETWHFSLGAPLPLLFLAPTGRLGRPEDVADARVFPASPLATRITGHDLVSDLVSTRPVPLVPTGRHGCTVGTEADGAARRGQRRSPRRGP
ncbi:cupin domain-containing protein [Streptomyces olivaceoviridis]|uniref:cupin domain-containing protein n=1 Tax=Streptomyces olivaceoviridis TaxID=1921 RepID=UPI001674CE3F|nr:cupin domain-containing protein [Streptomyces olivaceoviridis]